MERIKPNIKEHYRGVRISNIKLKNCSHYYIQLLPFLIALLLLLLLLCLKLNCIFIIIIICHKNIIVMCKKHLQNSEYN